MTAPESFSAYVEPESRVLLLIIANNLL